jgi:hypothetical protein
MAPKIAMDADGDIPPCSVLQSKEYAERWDQWKREKYGGRQKAISTVERFCTKPRLTARPIPEPPNQKGWKRFFSCLRLRIRAKNETPLTHIQQVPRQPANNGRITS